MYRDRSSPYTVQAISSVRQVRLVEHRVMVRVISRKGLLEHFSKVSSVHSPFFDAAHIFSLIKNTREEAVNAFIVNASVIKTDYCRKFVSDLIGYIITDNYST